MIDPYHIAFDADSAGISIDPRRWPPTRAGVRALMDYLRISVHGLGGAVDPTEPLFRVQMWCGRLYEFDTVDDFPLFDLPCGCGDPDCVVIEWREGDDA